MKVFRKLSREKRQMVHVYLTEDEKLRVEQKAREIGISLSSYIKVKLFSKK